MIGTQETTNNYAGEMGESGISDAFLTASENDEWGSSSAKLSLLPVFWWIYMWLILLCWYFSVDFQSVS